MVGVEVGTMARPRSADHPSCPRCGGEQVINNGRSRTGRPRWECHACARPFGPTLGTPLYRLPTPAAEVARSLLVMRRRGSLSAAEAITGHKDETLERWLRAAATPAEALTDALGHDLP